MNAPGKGPPRHRHHEAEIFRVIEGRYLYDHAERPSVDLKPFLTGLCKAARAGGYAASTKNGRVNPAWSALESAAGGASNVDSYCDATLAEDAAEKAARKGTDVDDDDLDKGKPAKGPKPDKVKGGDSLYKIAVSVYGSSNMVDDLYEANKQAIGADSSKLLPISHGRPIFLASPCRSRRVMSRPTA